MLVYLLINFKKHTCLVSYSKERSVFFISLSHIKYLGFVLTDGRVQEVRYEDQGIQSGCERDLLNINIHINIYGMPESFGEGVGQPLGWSGYIHF